MVACIAGKMVQGSWKKVEGMFVAGGY